VSAYVGDDSMLEPILIDENAESSYEYGLEGNECPDEPESSPDGSFHIMSNGLFLAIENPLEKDSNLIVTENLDETSWIWEPRTGTDVDVWGYIHNEHGYLTTDCKKKGDCTIRVKESISGADSLWRKWRNKIISKTVRSRSEKPAILTLNSDGVVIATGPSANENQDWTLVHDE